MKIATNKDWILMTVPTDGKRAIPLFVRADLKESLVENPKVGWYLELADHQLGDYAKLGLLRTNTIGRYFDQPAINLAWQQANISNADKITACKIELFLLALYQKPLELVYVGISEDSHKGDDFLYQFLID